MFKTLLIAACATLTVAAPATAAMEAPSATVRTSDLNLAERADQMRLQSRIAATARRVCQTGELGTAADRQRDRCIAQALAGAAPQADRLIAAATNGQRLAQGDLAITG